MTLKSVFLGFLILLMLSVGYVIHTGIAVVHVNTPDARFWVPIPVALGHWVGWFIKLPPQQQKLKEFLEHREAIAAILRQLQDLPDSNLVEVSKAREHVQVFKRADALHVHVDTPKEQVKVRLPLRMVEGMVKALGQPSVTVGDLMACLESQPSGDLVYVKTPREEVRVWLW